MHLCQLAHSCEINLRQLAATFCSEKLSSTCSIFLYIFLHVLTFHFLFVTDSCRFKELTCPFKARQRLILTCPACRKFWHARQAIEFGMPGMPEILARGACWVLISC